MLTDTDVKATSTEAHESRITAHLHNPKFVRRSIVEGVLVLALVVAGSLLMWGGGFAKDMVHDQLAAQKIFFPPANSEGLPAQEFPGLQQYGGKQVVSGPMAKAYANEFIGAHLKATAGGKTYSETSTASRANPKDAELAQQVQTLFRGETLRGLLLYAWGWSVVGSIAIYSAFAAFLCAAVLLGALIVGFARPEHR
jgi:hypothetical protein